MKNLIIVALITIVFPVLSYAGEKVQGYWKDTNRDGIKDTYVQPYERTQPNNIRTDNYGYPGNYNPNKGEMTPRSNSPRENYPYNPNPYDKRKQF